MNLIVTCRGLLNMAFVEGAPGEQSSRNSVVSQCQTVRQATCKDWVARYWKSVVFPIFYSSTHSVAVLGIYLGFNVRWITILSNLCPFGTALSTVAQLLYRQTNPAPCLRCSQPTSVWSAYFKLIAACYTNKSRAIAGRTARWCCKFRYILNLTTA